ncbi:MAG: repressor LexA [Chloroflexi bacterium RBG_13_51_36]|nr:MAG: repressor LexA [Chloroflexi bacterium RBG_13_51_36]
MRKPEIRERILEYIRHSLDEKGYAPTVRDIMRGCNISSTSLVQYHLNILEREGQIRRDPEVFRSIQLVEKDIIEVPLLGTIAAGEPIPVVDSGTWTNHAEETLRVTTDLVGRRGDIYALKVKGTSMLDALINDGDIVIMEATQTVADGETAAVWLKNEQEVTLKKIYREPRRIRLQPANSEMKSIYTRPENVEVQGKVVAVLRKLED